MARCRVHVLTKTTTASSAFNFPLLWHRRRLREHGLDLSFFTTAADRLYDCDVLFLYVKAFGTVWKGVSAEIQTVLDRARRGAGRVLWFDTSASTGTTQFEVLPHVDGYYKALALADRRAYRVRYRGGRIFTDARASTAQGTDPFADAALPAESDLSRIGVSWNTALGDHGLRAQLFRRIRKYFPPFRRYSAWFVSPGADRPIPIACRLGLHHGLPAVVEHRNQIRETLERDFGVPVGMLARDAYLAELRAAKVGVSPFGYGEICLRDYEVILAGGALVKPDLSHIETWPPLFVDGQTYVAHRWDAADLKAKLEELLAGDRWREIAQAAQRLYRKYLFETEGREEFCRRVAGMARST